MVVSFALSILLQVSKVSAMSHSSGQPQSLLTSSQSPHNDVELIGIRLVRKVTRQLSTTANGLLSSRLTSPKCPSILSLKAMETFQRIKESAEYQIFSINTHHQSSLTFQRTMDLASTCWSARSFWALITILSSLTVLYFAIWIRKALLSSLSIWQILESYSQASDSSSAIRNQCNDDHDLWANVTPKRYDVPRALLLFAHLRGLFARLQFEISDLWLIRQLLAVTGC